MPVNFVLSEGSAADCLFAEELIADMTVDKLLAAKSTIPMRSGTWQLHWGWMRLSRPRPTVRGNCRLTATCTVTVIWWRTVFWISNVGGRIATRYAKKLASFAAAIEIWIIAMWLKIL